ncbi:uncharacterized protein Z518_09898 [Rhinocladiella mackenziei CBS 650.93]|uniref:BTB domain transcription factor n=1 Tax=Rhinocladiella mackenziei CBS 650.93 TaxID=1442369 RepID=A0A0D2GR83_9EURO|nr:uncharacterized protein Z518_09898 [Rhinocladiella mackenziei CBS 650.93]KIX00833.1 hypothetical protein Z518_09898 [Rhinocladiella mackenziei CBS 650.93]
MTGRRHSARIAAQSQNSSPPQPKPSPAGKKRKKDTAGSSPRAKRGKKDAEPKQETRGKTTQNGQDPTHDPTNKAEQAQEKSEEFQAPQVNGNATESKQQQEEKKPTAQDEAKMTNTVNEPAAREAGGDEPRSAPEEPPMDKVEDGEQPQANGTHTEVTQPKADAKVPGTNGDAVVPDAREADPPSSILEKGVIYFFFRARVNVDDPQDVRDVARTYMVMRPIPLDAKLGDGPIGDQGNCRLLALPKKVLPLSSKDRFTAFVEKAKVSFSDLKESFMAGLDYATKTAGISHTPPVTPVAEGVYAITSTGRESHLAYLINIPRELGEVQKDLGLRERGSFVTSVKNPTQPAPPGTSLPKGPEYPQEILDDFRGLRWKPLEPKYLDYVNTQFLLIGKSFDHATEEWPRDERENNETPQEEMEKLEGEDEIRVEHLKGDDAVFTDLGITAKEFPKVPTTW